MPVKGTVPEDIFTETPITNLALANSMGEGEEEERGGSPKPKLGTVV